MTTIRFASTKRMLSIAFAAVIATAGITAVQASTTSERASAGVCGSAATSSGYAYANNPCGYAYAEVSRISGGKMYVFNGQVYKKSVSVSSSYGTRNGEGTSRW